MIISFPLGIPFPKNFRVLCKKILTRLFRVFVHVYIHHFERLVVIGAVSDALVMSSLYFKFDCDWNVQNMST